MLVATNIYGVLWTFRLPAILSNPAHNRLTGPVFGRGFFLWLEPSIERDSFHYPSTGALLKEKGLPEKSLDH